MGNIRERVEQTVALYQGTPPAENIAVVEHWLRQGLDLLAATQLAQLVPLAFCRWALRHSGIEFSSGYRVMGESQSRNLDHEEIYCEALLLSETMAAAPNGRESCMAVARRSAEFAAINKLLREGSRLQGLSLGEPVLVARNA